MIILMILFRDDLVPRMHIIEDRTAAKDSLHLCQLITTEFIISRRACLLVFCRRWRPFAPVHLWFIEDVDDLWLHLVGVDGSGQP